jgi:hypothetical protein
MVGNFDDSNLKCFDVRACTLLLVPIKEANDILYLFVLKVVSNDRNSMYSW